jgi:large subunit ribosomal protein L23
MSALLRLIDKPIVTEKAETLRDTENVYTFAVAISANKRQIAAAVQAVFGVDVDEVCTAVVRGKNKRVGTIAGRKANWKKAYVKVSGDQVIEALETAQDFSEEALEEAES